MHFGFSDGYDTQQVCLNGHQATDCYNKYPAFRKDYCDQCGAKTVTNCHKCGAAIKGYYHSMGIISTQNAPVPSHCENCGTPYPWTEANNGIANQALTSNSPSKESSIELLKKIFQRFHLFARQLQVRHGDRDTIEFNDEYDVQDAIHALLKINFDDVREEEYTPSYAGGSARMDFLIHDSEIAIEIKKTRKGLKDKQVGDEIGIDILRYKSHPKCKNLVCFIYDPEGRIGNPIGLERDLTLINDDLEILTIVSPKGH